MLFVLKRSLFYCDTKGEKKADKEAVKLEMRGVKVQKKCSEYIYSTYIFNKEPISENAFTFFAELFCSAQS